MKSLGDYSTKELNRIEHNANRILVRGNEKQQQEANDMLAQISAERINRSSEKFVNCGGMVWDNENRNHRIGYLDGKMVAEIKQDENHNSENEEVYSVYVRGVRYDKRYRYISDARKGVESEFLE